MAGVLQNNHNYNNVSNNKVAVVLGAQWGDEGKGKVVDMLAVNADIVCRYQGGSNAGHTVIANGIHYYFHLVPSGITNPNSISVIGNGVVVHLPEFFRELEENLINGSKDWEKRILISDRAHLVFDFHQKADGFQEQEKTKKGNRIGTTKKGIGPTYSSKASRNSVRLGDLLGDFSEFSKKYLALAALYKLMFPDLDIDTEEELARYKTYVDKIRPFVRETITYLNRNIKEGKKVLVEGANAVMLDIDLGTYPFVTSSNCGVGGVCTGLGIPPSSVGDVIGVAKAYITRLGDGPFPTELKDEVGDKIRQLGNEVGVTTKRNRRCGWLDLVLLNYTHMTNGYTALCLTKLDILDSFPEIKIGVAYKLGGKVIDEFPSNSATLEKVEVEYITMPGWNSCTRNVKSFSELPINAQRYVKTIEEYVQVPIKWIGIGKGREDIINV